MRSIFIVSTVIALLVFSQCKKESDTEPPKIELISPVNCDSIWRGDFITFEANFSDNEELATYAVNIFENFDHETYGSSDQGCPQEPEKNPFNPFKYVTVQDIPPGQTQFTTGHDIIVPESIDTGDYLFIVYAQDKKGLQSYYSVSLKIVTDDIK